jgi:hypothetical protein
MIVYELVCACEHRFEGWFASAEDYARQRESTMIRCPVCDDAAVQRRPSANVQVSRAAVPASERSDASVVGGDAEALRQLRRLIERTDNVGLEFAEEARKIHYDEVPKRAIRGQATREDADALRDEGIDFMSLPSFLTRDLQ